MCKAKKYHGTSNTRIDKCMVNVIKILKLYNLPVIACCCGHKKYPMSIIVDNGRNNLEIFSHKVIPRTRNFYKKDKEGYYYIPEAIEDNQ